MQAPTLVIWGEQDRLVAPRLAARTAQVLRARLLMLPGVGHVAQIEAPDMVARAVAGMWDAVAAGRWPGEGRMSPDRGVGTGRSEHRSADDFEELASWRYRRSLSRPPS